MPELQPTRDNQLLDKAGDYTMDLDNLLKEILYGRHHTTVSRNAILKDGIKKLNKTQRSRFLRIFKKRSKKFSFAHFIPASGSGS